MKHARRNLWLVISIALIFVLAPITFDWTDTVLAPQSAFSRGGNSGGDGRRNLINERVVFIDSCCAGALPVAGFEPRAAICSSA